MRESQRVRFVGDRTAELVGILERPTAEPRFLALFAHCFTCSKDLKSIVRLSRDLVQRGIAVFRFDFTGIGESGGDFSTSTFADNIADLQAALRFMSQTFAEPKLIIGHSLGGAAALATAAIEQNSTLGSSLAGVCTLAAPSETPHLAEILTRLDPTLQTEPRGVVTIGGQSFEVDRKMLDGLRDYDLRSTIQSLDLPTLLFHSTVDETVSIAHAYELQRLLKKNCSLITLPDADHLFVKNPAEINFLGTMISTWSARIGIG